MHVLSGFGFDVHQWVFAIVAALCLGMSKTGFAGMSMLGVALMAEVWSARESTGVILPMLIFGDFFAVMLFNRHALWPEVWRILPPAFLGVVIGFGIFQLVPGAAFGPVIGWIVLAMNTRSMSFHGRDGLRAVPFFSLTQGAGASVPKGQEPSARVS